MTEASSMCVQLTMTDETTLPTSPHQAEHPIMTNNTIHIQFKSGAFVRTEVADVRTAVRAFESAKKSRAEWFLEDSIPMLIDMASGRFHRESQVIMTDSTMKRYRWHVSPCGTRWILRRWNPRLRAWGVLVNHRLHDRTFKHECYAQRVADKMNRDLAAAS
jgi:hypothetical protein